MKVRHDKVVRALEVLCGIGNIPELLGDIINHYYLEGALCDVTRGETPVVHPFLLRLTQPYCTLHETPQQNTLPNTLAHHILLLGEGG